MASPPKATGKLVESFLGLFTGQYALNDLPKPSDPALAPGKVLYTSTERDRLLKTAQMSKPVRPDGYGVDPEAYFGAVSRKGIADTLDNERLLQMAPEISYAAAIMVPSILSPNDMRSGVISIVCDGSATDETKATAISKYLTDLFEERFNLSTTLPKWIYQAMYRSGSTPLMVLPLKMLLTEMDDTRKFVETASTEDISERSIAFANEDIFGFGNSSSTGGLESLTASLESMCDDIIPGLRMATPDKKPQKRGDSSTADALKALVKEVCSSEALSILDNPNAITLPNLKNQSKAGSNTKKVRQYLDEEIYALPDDSGDTEIYDNPVWMELPSEAVIPIFTPGTPADHLGYFVVMDENGHPIDAGSTRDNNLVQMAGPSNYANSQRSNTFYNLFQSYGFTRNDMYDRVPDREVMEMLYQQIIEHHLTSKSMQAGYSNIGLGNNSAMYRAMFSRFMAQKRTRLLFVPKEFMTYFCFRHSRQGTGVSKLDDLKWILSLRISLLVSRMISAFKNSIDKKRLTINLADTHVSNVNQHMRTALQQAVSKDMWSFSYNPSDVAALIAERSYSIDIKGVQGIGDYSIEKDLDTRQQSIMPDESLADDLKNMEYLGLEVPPSVMNNLSENEFSRSIATTNIIFSRRLSIYQKVVCKYVSEFIQNYCKYSKEISSRIKSIVDPGSSDKSSTDKSDKTNDGTLVTDDKKSTGSRVNMMEIIKSIRVTLPDPTMAPNNAVFDTLTTALQTYDTIGTACFPDELSGGNQVVGAAIAGQRAQFKAGLIERHLRNAGLTDNDFPDIFEGISDEKIIKVRQSFMGVAAALKKQDAVFKAVLGGDDGGAGGGDMSGGGTDSTLSGFDTGSAGTSDNDFGDTTSTPVDTGSDDSGGGDSGLITDSTDVGSSGGDSSGGSDQSAGPTGQSLV